MRDVLDMILIIAKMSAGNILEWVRETLQIAIGLVVGWAAWKFVKGDY